MGQREYILIVALVQDQRDVSGIVMTFPPFKNISIVEGSFIFLPLPLALSFESGCIMRLRRRHTMCTRLATTTQTSYHAQPWWSNEDNSRRHRR